MAETIVCGRCGARSWAGAATCYACGLDLMPSGTAPMAPAQPPMPYAPVPPTVPAPPQFAPPAAPPAPWFGAPTAPGQPPMPYAPVPPALYSARPTGITVMTVGEIVIGLVGLLIAYDLFYWADYRFTYDGGLSGGLDLLLGFAYLVTSIMAFGVASGIFRMRPWAWMPAFILSVVLLYFIVFSVVEWGITILDVIGALAHLGVLAYLNTNPVRQIFGRRPVAFLQGPS